MDSRVFGSLAAGIFGLVCVSSRADTYPAYEIAADETKSIVLSSDTTNSSMVIHGALSLDSADRAHRNIWSVLKSEGAAEVYIDLGPAAGDQGRLFLQYVQLRSTTDNSAHGVIRVGENGGGANACLDLGAHGSADQYFNDFRLSGNARTDKDVFDVMRVGRQGSYKGYHLSNANTKPMRVSFTNFLNQTADSPGWIGGFWNNSFFSMPHPGGDIILRGTADAPIKFSTTHTQYNLFDTTSLNALLRTEGDCDMILDSTCYGKASGVITINATNCVWGHTGDFCCTGYGGVRVTSDGQLPYGTGCGVVRVTGTADASYPFELLDLNGTTQFVNGVVLVQRACVTNSASCDATLIFGAGDTDGCAAGDFKEANIAYRKTGTGTLSFADATFPAFSADGGTLCVTGRVHVGTLALTNVCLSGSGELTYDTLALGENVRSELSFDQSNVVTHIVRVGTLPVPIVKGDDGLVTCVTPTDACRSPLDVRAGVLRFGAASTTNAYWRFTARKARQSVTYTLADVPAFRQTVHLGLGSLALFNENGICCNGWISNAAVGAEPSTLKEASVTASQQPFLWNNAKFQELYGTDARDPILGGGTSLDGACCFVKENESFCTRNWYDHVATSGTDCKIATWASAVLFTNAELVADNPATWVTLSWRLKADWARRQPTTYSLRRMVNGNSKDDYPHVTDWTLESSPDGISWEVMDVRSNQTFGTKYEFGMDPQFNYTYNAHVPYVFSAKNGDWRFDTFGAVRVAAGATLDLDALKPENIAVNGLTVDVAAGGGTITRFVPAEGGVLNLENVTEAQLRKRIAVPLALNDVARMERLSTWTVSINGAPVTTALLSYDAEGKRLTVRVPRGLRLFVR